VSTEALTCSSESDLNDEHEVALKFKFQVLIVTVPYLRNQATPLPIINETVRFFFSEADNLFSPFRALASIQLILYVLL
jgi:hypothetical protein